MKSGDFSVESAVSKAVLQCGHIDVLVQGRIAKAANQRRPRWFACPHKLSR
jgi:hypothetical protein